MFLTLANTSVKFYVFINAPFEGNIFESSLPLLYFPPTKFKHPNHQGATILACLLTLQSSLSTSHFLSHLKVLELPIGVMGVAIKKMQYGTVFKINKYKF